MTVTEQEQLQRLAEQLDCFTEDQHLLLSGWAPETAKAKRKRGEGPPYVLHGRHYFYPRKPYSDYLHSRMRERTGAAARDLL